VFSLEEVKTDGRMLQTKNFTGHPYKTTGRRGWHAIYLNGLFSQFLEHVTKHLSTLSTCLLIVGDLSFHLLKPRNDFWVSTPIKVTCCHRCGNCSNKCNVCQSHMVGSSNISSGLDHVGHPAKNLFNSVIISLGRNFSSKHLWVHNVPDCFVECTHVKVQPRVHKCSGCHIFWIKLIIFSILSNKVSSSRL